MPLYFLMAIFPCTTGSHCRQVTIFLENVRFRNMRIMTLISIVSWLPMASSTSPFTYGAVEVIFGSIYFYFHLQTAPDLQDCPHSTNLPTIPESTLLSIVLPNQINVLHQLHVWLKVTLNYRSDKNHKLTLLHSYILWNLEKFDQQPTT